MRTLIKNYILLAVVLASCTERIELKLGEAGAPKLVVFGEITNEPRGHTVYLSTSVPYFHNDKIPVVSEAVVSIYDGDETVILKEDPYQPGAYLTPADYAGTPGKTYTLNISNVDINADMITEEYSATTVMKSVVDIDKITVIYDDLWDEWQVGLYATDPGDTKDYYLFKIYKNDVLYTDSLFNYIALSDELYNGNSITGSPVQFFFNDKGEVVSEGDVVTLESYGITEEYYDFINGALLEMYGSYPMFSGPPANVKGNISNGALGFFAVMQVSRASVTYHGEVKE